MSNLPTTIEAFSTDMTQSEVDKVKKFIEDGLPGIAEIKDDTLTQMLDLYLNGSSYSQIANILRVRKVLVLYFAHTANWEQLRQEYINEVQENLKNRLIDSKIRNQEFMLLLSQAYQRKVGEQLMRYLSTNDPSHLAEIDSKEVGLLMRIIEMVDGLDGNGKDKNGKTPSVGFNLGNNGAIVEKIGENKLSITPKDSTVGDLLQQLADERREKEKTIKEIKKESNNESK